MCQTLATVFCRSYCDHAVYLPPVFFRGKLNVSHAHHVDHISSNQVVPCICSFPLLLVEMLLYKLFNFQCHSLLSLQLRCSPPLLGCSSHP